MLVPNEIIRASAGTGKTHQLTNRYLRLLFATEKPERIIALTFSRKAASEFFEKIFNRLTAAAADAAAAENLSRELGLPSLKSGDFLAQLRQLLEKLPRLQLATYDSFFSRIVRNFPYDLGLSAPPVHLDDRQKDEAVRQTQHTLSQKTARDSKLLQELWENFKRSNRDAESKQFSASLTEYIGENHELYQEADDPAYWGDPAIIFPGGNPRFDPETKLDPVALSLEISRCLPSLDLTENMRGQWEAFVSELAEWDPFSPPTSAIETFFEKFFENYDDLETSPVNLGRLYRKNKQLSAPLGTLARQLARHIYSVLLRHRLEATQAIYRIIHRFEEIYRDEIRLAGKLTYTDTTRLLSGDNPFTDPARRGQIDYHLDARYDHWLLDEFQDTSQIQWRAIRNLIDEILQNAEHDRTLFIVGDTKQSIYAWRGSDPRLFDHVEKTYSQNLERGTLPLSYRSAPAVLEMVNAIFGQNDFIADFLGQQTADRWKIAWTPHQASPKTAGQTGHAAYIHASKENDPDLLGTITQLLRTLDPIANRRSVAILVDTNSAAQTIIDHLRAQEPPILCSLSSSTRPGADNAAAAVLISLLQIALHPEDTLAWQHLNMTPLFEKIQQQHPDAGRLSAHLLQLHTNGGNSSVIDYWNRLIPDTARDAFTRKRIQQIADLAIETDRDNLPLADFARQLADHEVREYDIPGQVAVMTIHQSKGLDWDIVIIPSQTTARSFKEIRRGLFCQRDADTGAIKWILQMPPKKIADPVLLAARESAEQNAAYENLCKLYVALTRAKRGLYFISHAVAETSTAHNTPNLITRALNANPADRQIAADTYTIAWQSGRPEWFVNPTKTSPPNVGASLDDARNAPSTKTRQKKSGAAASRGTGRRPVGLKKNTDIPSSANPPSQKNYRQAAAQLLVPAKAAEHGTRIHALLEQLEWLPPAPDKLPSGIPEELRELLSVPAVRELFAKPDMPTILWRETPFNYYENGTHHTGIFDRVHIFQNADGSLSHAQIIDYKTDRIPDKLPPAEIENYFRERHGHQLAAYRRALSKLLNLPDEKIQTSLLLVTPGLLVSG